MNPNVNYGLWVTMMFQCRLITYKYATVVGNGDNEGRCYEWGEEKYGSDTLTYFKNAGWLRGF